MFIPTPRVARAALCLAALTLVALPACGGDAEAGREEAGQGTIEWWDLTPPDPITEATVDQTKPSRLSTPRTEPTNGAAHPFCEEFESHADVLDSGEQADQRLIRVLADLTRQAPPEIQPDLADITQTLREGYAARGDTEPPAVDGDALMRAATNVSDWEAANC
jgi:hypothetical protein